MGARRLADESLVTVSEKPRVVREEDVPSPDTETTTIGADDEQFEWREVVRGLTDPQVYFTAVAYLGLIVGLYSYSLFL